jgi:hypothetical protein
VNSLGCNLEKGTRVRLIESRLAINKPFKPIQRVVMDVVKSVLALLRCSRRDHR